MNTSMHKALTVQANMGETVRTLKDMGEAQARKEHELKVSKITLLYRSHG